jgi:endoglucanase
VAAIHYYTPMGFTHQCENWDGSPLGRLANLPFPASPDNPAVTALAAKLRAAGDEEAAEFLAKEFSGPWTAAHIDADFAKAAEWSGANGCPVILNEFGVLDFCVDPASRAYWIRAVRQAAEKNGIGWTYWEVDHGFGFIADRKSTDGFDAGVIDALLGSDR